MAARILALRVFYFASFAALGALAPFFPRWLLARGVEGVALGAVLAMLPALALVGPPFVGVIADRLGLQGRVLRLTSLGASLSLAALAVAGGGGECMLGLLVVAVLAYAAFRAPMTVMADVVAIRQAPLAGVSYGRLRNWGSAGSLVGAIAIGRLVDPQAPSALPVAAALLLLVAHGATYALPDCDHPPEISLREEGRILLISPDVPLFLASSFLAEIALSSYDLGFAIRLGELGASSTFIGCAWGLGVMSEMVLMAYAGSLIRRFTPSRLVVAALFVGAFRYMLLGSLGSILMLAAVQPLHALSTPLFWISAISYVKGRVAPRALASAQGLFAAVMAAGSAVGMFVWGSICRVGGGAVMFAIASAVALCAALLALLWNAHAREVRQAI